MTAVAADTKQTTFNSSVLPYAYSNWRFSIFCSALLEAFVFLHKFHCDWLVIFVIIMTSTFYATVSVCLACRVAMNAAAAAAAAWTRSLPDGAVDTWIILCYLGAYGRRRQGRSDWPFSQWASEQRWGGTVGVGCVRHSGEMMPETVRRWFSGKIDPAGGRTIPGRLAVLTAAHQTACGGAN